MVFKLCPHLSLVQNILTLVHFFYGSTCLLFYNTILNLSDLLGKQFNEQTMDYMSTFPLFYNWFDFAVAVVLTLLTNYLPHYPSNLFAHTSFILQSSSSSGRSSSSSTRATARSASG